MLKHIEEQGHGYSSYLANVMGKNYFTFNNYFMNLRKSRISYRSKERIVEAINKVKQANYKVDDFDWSVPEGKKKKEPALKA